eukprot:jgi/Chrzof1/11898/Cz06g13290.t1
MGEFIRAFFGRQTSPASPFTAREAVDTAESQPLINEDSVKNILDSARQPAVETVVLKSELPQHTVQDDSPKSKPPLQPSQKAAQHHAPSQSGWLLPCAYGLTNLSSVVTIVLANKMVLYTYEFSFAVTLTWLHTIFTAAGMILLSTCGVFEKKTVPLMRSLPVACVYVGFIVFNNLSIQLNTVGFYQISKIAITPVVVAIEYCMYGKKASAKVLLSILVLLAGIAVSTITDSQVSSNPLGMIVAAVNIFVTGLYQVWAGTKQKELGLNGMQLLHQMAPSAVVLLGVLIPALEPVGFTNPTPDTVLGYEYTVNAVAWIVFSSVLGLVVTLSTFLFIGVTSSLTYNVVGHLKTVCIVTSGVLLYNDEMTAKKLTGLVCAMVGIVWYSQIKMQEAKKPNQG